PGADDVTPDEELRRLQTGIEAVRRLAADIPVSVDTFRAAVARKAVAEMGADIINDVSGGLIDPEIYHVAAAEGAPYILMHMRGTPATMQQFTDYSEYGGVVPGVAAELHKAMMALNLAGVRDVIIDPGFGFSKTAPQNYELMRGLPELSALLDGLPTLVGISRKSMIYKPLGLTPADALPGTTALNTLALERGAAIIRVHDVAAAVQTRDVMQLFNLPLSDDLPS
ncbi:MAG: dihydropteroate synthase, partial [Muribaculaceae bacterium]|nr:dihydropteroate synthase [Muribaculaceae bacterium]